MAHTHALISVLHNQYRAPKQLYKWREITRGCQCVCLTDCHPSVHVARLPSLPLIFIRLPLVLGYFHQSSAVLPAPPGSNHGLPPSSSSVLPLHSSFSIYKSIKQQLDPENLRENRLTDCVWFFPSSLSFSLPFHYCSIFTFLKIFFPPSLFLMPDVLEVTLEAGA